ncbi:BLUF domain-containing protein [Bdellovibrio sp. NC01]|uniref:BLUF domain-containing protein n=1 Tax=Bdellovibrio sp. NC01 TaxID=2220073 RepID=UPI00115B13AC|nr:BLUF domain-containing protein [Bdellovibrio sp. NC01]QDK36774.1 hypothetical protein DOE51_03755 [Bdellovibrio sp. NC01]
MPKVFHLIYLSHAVADLSYTDIRDILETSRKNNSLAETTGVLIYRDGYFVQVLEGNKATVLDLVEKIKEDDRNYKLKVLVQTESSQRYFKEWSMGFLDGDIEANTTDALLDLFDICYESEKTDEAKIMEMVKRFSESVPPLK